MIHSTDKINVYVRNINNNVLAGYKTQAQQRIKRVQYLDEHGQYEYTKKYKKLKEDKSIVYFDVDEDSIVAKKNEMAHFKTLVDIIELESMINNGYKRIVANELGKNYKTIDVIIHKKSLEECLNDIVGDVMLTVKDREPLIQKVNVRQDYKLLRSRESLNSALREQGLNFYIDKFQTSRVVDGKKKNFKSAWRVLRLTDK